MAGRIARWVFGAVSFVASVIAIDGWLRDRGPESVFGSLEVHPAGWALISAVSVGVFGALVSPWILPRLQKRKHEFMRLGSEIRAMRTVLIHKDDELVMSPKDRLFDLGTRLERLGVDLLGPKDEVDYAAFIEMAERGAWREARRRFPLGRRRQRVQDEG